MDYVVSKKFKKSFDKLPKAVKKQFLERKKLFEANPLHPLLHNHSLVGGYSDCKSFNVNGDVRIIFAYIDSGAVHLIDIGTYSQLYG